MKNQIKLLSALLIVIFSISLCTVSAFAVPVDDTIATQPVQTEPVATETIATTPEPTETQATIPPTTAPTTKATQPKTQPTTKEPVYTTKPATQATTTQRYTQATQYYATWATTAPTQPPVLETDAKRIDEKTLDKSDWEDIKNQLMNNSDDSNDADNFDFIQKNSDDEDNGLWLLIVGIILVVAGVGIIAFWVVYTIRKKRYIDNHKNGRGNGNNHNNKRSAGDEYHPRRERRETTPYERRQINKRSKFDTGEVEIPRNRHSSRGNGTRYRR